VCLFEASSKVIPLLFRTLELLVDSYMFSQNYFGHMLKFERELST